MSAPPVQGPGEKGSRMNEAKRKRTFPPHLGDRRAFKARKRRELAALERAVYNCLHGAAYTPLRDVGVVLRQVQEWRRNCSAKAWGR
jgi:hypothetical protein